MLTIQCHCSRRRILSPENDVVSVIGSVQSISAALYLDDNWVQLSDRGCRKPGGCSNNGRCETVRPHIASRTANTLMDAMKGDMKMMDVDGNKYVIKWLRAGRESGNGG